MRSFEGFADCFEGPTHVHNLPMQQGYLKLGRQIMDSRLWFHQWLAQSRARFARGTKLFL